MKEELCQLVQSPEEKGQDTFDAEVEYAIQEESSSAGWREEDVGDTRGQQLRRASKTVSWSEHRLHRVVMQLPEISLDVAFNLIYNLPVRGAWDSSVYMCTLRTFNSATDLVSTQAGDTGTTTDLRTKRERGDGSRVLVFRAAKHSDQLYSARHFFGALILRSTDDGCQLTALQFSSLACENDAPCEQPLGVHLDSAASWLDKLIDTAEETIEADSSFRAETSPESEPKPTEAKRPIGLPSLGLPASVIEAAGRVSNSDVLKHARTSGGVGGLNTAMQLPAPLEDLGPLERRGTDDKENAQPIPGVNQIKVGVNSAAGAWSTYTSSDEDSDELYEFQEGQARSELEKLDDIPTSVPRPQKRGMGSDMEAKLKMNLGSVMAPPELSKATPRSQVTPRKLLQGGRLQNNADGTMGGVDVSMGEGPRLCSRECQGMPCSIQ